MKIRQGFVSNSSSSSFIIGLAIVKNEKILKKVIKEYILKDNCSEYGIFELKNLKKIDKKRFKKEWELPYQYLAFNSGKNIEVFAHINQYYSVCMSHKKVKDQKIFAYRVGNNEHDHFFATIGGVCKNEKICDDTYCELCLERGLEKAKNIEFYNDKQRKILELLTKENDILDNQICQYGADRNG